jgi:hypothetical protein
MEGEKSVKITIRKRKANYIYFIMYFIMIVMFLRSELGFPSLITYSIDVVNLILMLYLLKIKYDKNTKIFRNYVLVFLLYVCLGLVLFRQSKILFLWGLRSNFRYYIFFIACALMLDREDCTRILDFFKKMLVVNAFVCTFQYFILGYHRDILGGLFGSASGCNGYMNIFMIIAISYAAVQYLREEIPFGEVAILTLLSVYISILSELKVFFVELLIIFIIASITTRFSFKKLGIITISLVALSAIAWGLPKIYPEWSELFSVNGIIENLTSEGGYTGQGDLNRLTAIASINAKFSNMTSTRLWFGTGLGSWEYSDTFDFLTSTNYLTHSLTHYAWISYAWIYLELGYIGLFFFGGFFVLSGVFSRKIKSIDNHDKVLLDTAFIMAFLAIILAIFNVSLRMESGYHVYFVLSLPLVVSRAQFHK